jgi:hypothetical protein
MYTLIPQIPFNKRSIQMEVFTKLNAVEDEVFQEMERIVSRARLIPH